MIFYQFQTKKMNNNFIKSNWITYSIILFLLFVSSCNEGDQKVINLREGLSNFDALEYPNKKITDGPYLYNEEGKIIVKWLENEDVIENTITASNFGIIEKNFGFVLKPEWLDQSQVEIDYKQEFDKVEKIIAISDIHGQYKLFVKLLREYQVIDEHNNWSFGSGHLIVVGDIFDRGPQVNEALWLVFKLEHQASEVGGKVHYLMGNHEVLIFNQDYRYVNEKYMTTAEKLNTTYDQLYSEKTVLGQWLRTKPVIIQINDILFVHAGISPEFVKREITAEQANKVFLNQIIDKSKAALRQDSILNFWIGRNGPIWYRGYFQDENITRNQVDTILNYFNKKHIVVGHTSHQSIVSLFRERIFGVDASIKNAKYGEVLIYDKGDFFRGTIKMTPKFGFERNN